jgi:hypothetical protein
MAAKSPRGPIHNSYLTSHLRELRFYELDRVYLRQLRRLSQIVWNARLKRDNTPSKSVSSSLSDISTANDTANPTQKTP